MRHTRPVHKLPKIVIKLDYIFDHDGIEIEVKISLQVKN